MNTIAWATCSTSIRGSGRTLAVRLQLTRARDAGHIGQGIADVDLAAGDVVLAAVQRRGLGQAADGVLGGGIGRRVWARDVGRDRAVVDDAAAARVLVLHDLDGLLRAEEGAVQVGADDRQPLFGRSGLRAEAWRAATGVVEQQVEAAEGLLGFREQGFDGFGIRDVGDDAEHARASGFALLDASRRAAPWRRPATTTEKPLRGQSERGGSCRCRCRRR